MLTPTPPTFYPSQNLFLEVRHSIQSYSRAQGQVATAVEITADRGTRRGYGFRPENQALASPLDGRSHRFGADTQSPDFTLELQDALRVASGGTSRGTRRTRPPVSDDNPAAP